MWSICRVDVGPDSGECDFFEIQCAHRKRDLDMDKASKSGFAGPDDELVIVSPSGKVTEPQ